MQSPPAQPILSPLIRELMIGVGIMAVVLTARSFSLTYPGELSADESELLVQIGRYHHDPLPWRSVDGSTIGPANPWFLLLLGQAGWPLTYGGLHLLAALLQSAIVAASYYTVRVFLPLSLACLAAIAGTLAVAGSASINFMYFATELVPALALSLGLLALFRARHGGGTATAWLCVSGFCSGLSPWAKLQAAPIAAALIAMAIWRTWTQSPKVGTSTGRRIAPVVFVASSALLPSVAITTCVLFGGVFRDFWASYVVANLGYAGDFSPGTALLRFRDLILQSQLNGLMTAVVLLGLFCAIRLLRGERRGSGFVPDVLPAAAGYLGIAVYSCLRPPFGFGHYHIFLINPLIVASGALLGTIQRDQGATPGRLGAMKIGRIACLLILPIGLLAVVHTRQNSALRRYLTAKIADANQDFPATVVHEIRRLAPDASTMVVWGWMPGLYVRSGLSCVTRHTVGHFLIDPGPSQAVLREQFLAEVRGARPEVIVDAVASDCFTWYWPVASSGIDSFPEFARFVRENYILASSLIGDQPGVPLRIFVRKQTGP